MIQTSQVTMKRRPSIATILASAALFFSLAGTGIAARHYLITSVSQIKPSVRTALRNRAGVRGPTGPTGVQGSAASLGPIRLVNSTRVELTDGSSGQAIAPCPAGDRVTGGGFSQTNAIVTLSSLSGDEWIVNATLAPGATEGSVVAFALCAS